MSSDFDEGYDAALSDTIDAARAAADEEYAAGVQRISAMAWMTVGLARPVIAMTRRMPGWIWRPRRLLNVWIAKPTLFTGGRTTTYFQTFSQWYEYLTP